MDNNVRVKREFRLGELEYFNLFDTIGNKIKSFRIFDKNSNGYKCTSKIYFDNTILTYTHKVKLFDGEKIIPTLFGKIFEELPNEKKVLDGIYEKTVDGKIIEKGEYNNNNQSGVWNFFYYDQNIQLDIDYGLYGTVLNEYYYELKKQEPFSGEFIFKQEDNDITEERKIKDGKRNGTTRYKDSNDKTIKKESYKDGVFKD